MTQESEKTVLMTVKAQVVGDFTPNDRYGETYAETLVRIGNRTWPVGLTYPWDYKHGYGDDRKRIVEIKNRDINDRLSEAGVEVDWSDVATAYEAWAIKREAEKEAATKVKRTADWEASWVHAFVKEAGTPAGVSFQIQPKDKYVAGGHVDMSLGISYKGHTLSVGRERVRGWGDNRLAYYKIYELRKKRFTKIASVVKAAKESIEHTIATAASRQAAAVESEKRFQEVKAMFPDEKVERTGDGQYRIDIDPNHIGYFYFNHHPAGTYRGKDRFTIRQFDYTITFEELVTVLTIAKNSVRRYRSNA